jgi:hypothetical protein
MDEGHIQPAQLFALTWALKDRPPPAEGEGADPELARALRDLPDAYQAPLGIEHRLGPETVDRLLAHTRTCKDCRMLLIEDGPGSRPPRTQADLAEEVRLKDEERHRKVVRFWAEAAGGGLTFVGAQVVFMIWRKRQAAGRDETGASTLQQDVRDKPKREIDPFMFGGIALCVVAAFLLADAYTIARELWIDFSRWKRAVPIIGKKWAEGEKKKS